MAGLSGGRVSDAFSRANDPQCVHLGHNIGLAMHVSRAEQDICARNHH
jgi:hypothetical protein